MADGNPYVGTTVPMLNDLAADSLKKINKIQNDEAGGGGAGGAVTVIDGGDVTQGTKADAAVTNPASSASVIALLKGILTLAAIAPTPFRNRGANATLNVKASAGSVFSLSCYNTNAANRFIQLHNTATIPAGAAVPVLSFLVPAGGMTIIGTDFLTANGVSFSTGIAFAFSTTADTYTAGTAADQSTQILFA